MESLLLVQNNKSVFGQIKHILTTLLFSSFYLFNLSSISSLSVILFLLLILWVSFLENNGALVLKAPRIVFVLFLFAFFCILSSLWAQTSSQVSIEKGVTIFEILCCMYVVLICYYHEGTIFYLLKSIMWSGVIVAVYTFWSSYGEVVAGLISGERIGTSFANANAVGMLMAESIVLFIFFSMFDRFKAIYLSSLIPIGVLLATQSRTALLEFILGVFMLLFYWIVSKGNWKKKFFGFLLILLFLFAGVCFVVQTHLLSGYLNRFESTLAFFHGSKDLDTSSRVRIEMIEYGLSLFFSHPFIGIGIGNAGVGYEGYLHNTYLHNNYIELLANGGIVGALLYYSIYLYSFRFLTKRGGLKNPINFICFSLLSMFLLADFGAVSYYSKGTYFVIFAIILQVCYIREANGTDQ